MQIIDSQVHIWAADNAQRPWPKTGIVPRRTSPYLLDNLLRDMDSAGVDGAIIVPPAWEGDRNDLGLDAARLYPQRFAVMGRIDVLDLASRNLIENWRRQPGMLGLRMVLRHEPWRSAFADGHLDWLWAAAEQHRVPLMIMAFPDQYGLVDAVAARHPDLKLTMDHLGIPSGTKDATAFAHLDDLIKLARRANVAVKASALPSYTSDVYPFRALHPHLHRVYDVFGPRRIFWGSDVTQLSCTLNDAVTSFRDEIPWLDNDDKAWIMGRGICAWLNWEIPAASLIHR